MFKRITSAALVFGMAALAPPLAAAQAVCAPRESVVAQLQEKYGEVRRGAGLQDGAAVIELWSSPRTGSWTIIMSRPSGVSCVMAAGEAWTEDKAFDTARRKIEEPGA